MSYRVRRSAHPARTLRAHRARGRVAMARSAGRTDADARSASGGVGMPARQHTVGVSSAKRRVLAVALRDDSTAYVVHTDDRFGGESVWYRKRTCHGSPSRDGRWRIETARDLLQAGGQRSAFRPTVRNAARNECGPHVRVSRAFSASRLPSRRVSSARPRRSFRRATPCTDPVSPAQPRSVGTSPIHGVRDRTPSA